MTAKNIAPVSVIRDHDARDVRRRWLARTNARNITAVFLHLIRHLHRINLHESVEECESR